MSGAPGWYEDPTNKNLQWYWDGNSYTQSRAAGITQPSPAPTATRVRPSWTTSWPAIIVGLLVCLVPGLVLLWLRPGTSLRTKSIVSGAIALFVAGSAIANTQAPSASSSAASGESPSVSATATTPTESSSPTESASPSASLTPSSTPTESAAAGSAVAAVEALPVKGRAPKTGYARAMFGSGWVDIDRNGCDTRNDMLKKYLTNKVMSGTCKVLSGTLADRYTASSIRFVYGAVNEVDIDHVVALSDAWQKGAAKWAFAKRVAFANDPLNLQPTDSSANRQKSDGDAATWLPSNKAYRCDYVAHQAAVKKKYGVWVTAAERDAMLRVLAACPDQAVPAPGPQPTIASNTGGAAPSSTSKSTPAPRPTPTKTSTGGRTDPRFATCKAAKAAGYGPYYEGKDPEYDWYIDRDHDGIVCE